MKKDASVKSYLIEKLKQEHCLWSYDNDSIQDMPDDMLIELVMLYLDIDEINMLFNIFSYKKMKRAFLCMVLFPRQASTQLCEGNGNTSTQ